MITSIKTVALYVRDQQKARDFYVDTLGFEVRADAEMGPLGRWLEVGPKGGQATFVLADAARFEKEDSVGKSADVTLTSDDITALYEELSAKGVTVSEPQTQEWGRFVNVTDPDGHEFVISEQK